MQPFCDDEDRPRLDAGYLEPLSGDPWVDSEALLNLDLAFGVDDQQRAKAAVFGSGKGPREQDGTTVHKQVYIYGSLDFSPTVVDRKFGLTWSVGGYLLTTALARLGGEAIGRMRARVLAEAKTTFASGYAQTIGLRTFYGPRSSPSSHAAALGRSTSSTHQAIAQPDQLPPSYNGRRSASPSTQGSG